MKNKLQYFSGALILTGFFCALANNFRTEESAFVTTTALPIRNISSVGGTKTICSITINSDDEIKGFKEVLGNDPRFNFKELVNGSDNWYDEACSSGVKCDAVVISGHFGGTFFSDKTPWRLSLAQIEKKSCAKSCAGVLEVPKEIYLFGCNTLATKADEDGRTPEQYLQVLLADGLERSFAERIVESRMGVTGEENLNRMRRAFQGVPAVYGFCKKSPLGPENAKVVKKYFANIGGADGYYQQLERLEEIKKNQPYRIDVMAQQENEGIAKEYENINRCFRQTYGVDSKDETAGKICVVRDDSRALTQRIQVLDGLLRTDKRLSYIELANDFFLELGKRKQGLTAAEQGAINQLKNNSQLKQDIESVLPKISFLMSYEYGVLAAKLGSDVNLVGSYVTPGLLKILNRGITQEELNLIQRLNQSTPLKQFIKISHSDLTPAVFKSEKAIFVLGYAQLNDAQTLQDLKSIALNSPSSGLRHAASKALGSLNQKMDDQTDMFLTQLNDESDSKKREAAAQSLGDNHLADDRVINAILSRMNVETDAWVQRRLAIYFMSVKIDNEAIQKQLIKNLSSNSLEFRNFSADALSLRNVKSSALLDQMISALVGSTSSVTKIQYALKKNRANLSAEQKSRITQKYPAMARAILN